jgi:hypothetical protein
MIPHSLFRLTLITAALIVNPMTIKAKIYQPAKNAMQSGRGKANRWILECRPSIKMVPDPLMGWNSGDSLQQIRVEFETQNDAIAYAQQKNIPFELVAKHHRLVRPKSYAANFAHNRRSAF